MLSVWCLCVALAAGAGAADVARALTGAARFAVSSSVLLGDAAASGGELGWRTQAQLVLSSQPDSDGLLLHFTLESPQLMLRGKHRNADFVHKPSVWDSMPSSSFLATWSDGHITAAYLDPADPPDVLDYKKALISLFQFQLEEGERNETDVSGFCHVHYDRVSDLVIRKSKMQCTWQGSVDEEEHSEEHAVERRRVLRVELGAEGGLRALAADEVLLLRGTDPQHALKARALHTLSRSEEPPAPARLPGGLGAALQRQPALARHELPLEPRAGEPEEPEESLEEALRGHRAAVEEAAAGSAAAAAAVLRLLPAVRAASAQQLRALLDHPDTDTDDLDGLVRVLGLAGSRGAQAAAREALLLGAAQPPREALGRQYLCALALAPEVDEWVVRDTLQLARRGGALAPAAWLASAAAAGRVPADQREAVVADVQHELTRGLSKCKDAACAATRLHALGQLRRASLAGLFLARAETGARDEALAAIAALAAGPPEGYFGSARRRLEAIALGHGTARSLDVRAAALQLALQSAADHPAALASMVGVLRARGPRELRRVCWLRLRQLAESREELARLLPRLDPRPRDWFRRAYDGTSSVLERSAGWARLDSAQLASGGVLSRGRVQLGAQAARTHRDLLTVELWTRGLESFASAPALPRAAREEDEGGEEEEEEAEGGLALTVAGVRTPDIQLFRGQGELLGHIWAGTGSAPTAVLRALAPLASSRHVFALQAGLLLAGGLDRAAALALDAQAVVSLWGRTARAGLALRGAGAESAWLRVRARWGRVSARALATLEPKLDIAAALDFYGAPQLCVHAALPDYTYTRNVTLASSLGGTRLRVRRARAAAVRVAGRTLALDAPNDAACRALGAAHEA